MIGPGAVVMSCSRVVDVFVGANSLLEVKGTHEDRIKWPRRLYNQQLLRGSISFPDE